MVLYHFSSEERKALWTLLTEFSASRPVSVIIMDGGPEGWSQLLICDFNKGSYNKRHVANAHPTGAG